MRAQVLRDPGPLAAGDSASSPLVASVTDDPVPAPGEVLIEVEVCAVCRTDLQLCEGDLGAHRLPIVPGHQIIGEIVAAGRGVDPGGPARVGARVGVAWIASACGSCPFCLEGRENLCDAARFTGWDRDGGYSTHVTAQAAFTYPIPPGFPSVHAAPLLCGGAIGYRSLRIAGCAPVGDLARGPDRPPRLGLYGFGASATCAIQIARHWGWDVSVATRSTDEQARAADLGASWTGGYDDLPPDPLDAAITFAPSGDVVVAALRATAKGGTVAINAIHLDRIPEFGYDLLWWERSLRSVANVTRADVVELLALAAGIPIQTSTETFGLSEANVALRRLKDGAIRGSAVLDARR